MENMQELLEELQGEEENLTDKEKNIFLWSDFVNGEEEDLTDEEKKYWEVRR